MTTAARKKSKLVRMIRPAHPGHFIRTEVIEPLGLSVTKAALPGPVAEAAVGRERLVLREPAGDRRGGDAVSVSR